MKPKLIKYTALISLFFIIVAVASFIQTMEPVNIVTRSVPFLRISPDTRADGIGDLGIATSADTDAMFWNQAKIPFAESKTLLSVNYNPWLKAYIGTVGGNSKRADFTVIPLTGWGKAGTLFLSI